MFGILTKKQAEKEFCKIAQSFKDIKEYVVSKSEIDLMIENKILKLREVIPQTPQTPLRKRANKILDKAEIMQEINSMLQQGLSTSEAQHQIIDIKGMCRKSCFFKYLKIVRNKSLQTMRTEHLKKTNEN